MEATALMKTCKFCKQPIGRDKRSDSEFCCNSCKARYHEAKKNNPGSEQNLSGFVPDFNNELAAPEDQTREQPEPLENLLDPATERPAPPPPQYITATVEIPNPDYESLKQKYDQIQNSIRSEEDTKRRLTKQLEQVQADDSAAIYIGCTAAGAGAGYFIGEQAKDNNDTHTDNQNKKAAGAIFGGIIGFLGGLVYDEFTSEQRKKDKETAIKNLRSQIATCDKKLFNLGQEEQTIGKKMLGLPRTIKTQKQIENPAFKNYELGKLLKGLGGLSALMKKDSSEESPTNLPVPASASLETDRIMKASTVANLDLPRLNFTGRWFQFLGKPQPRFFCLVHGMSGHGKSHFAFQLAEYLARNFGRVLYVSSEEGFSATLQEKINTLNIIENRLLFSDFKSAEDLIQNAPNKFHFFVLDSITNMQIDPTLLAQIRQHYNESGIIGICQNTKNGGIRGSNEFVFDSDMVINVENGIASTTKNRFCSYLASFKVFENFNGKRNSNKKPPKPDSDELDEGFRNII